jgi:predicted RNA-binding Zn-ribbon protein involved in translation (DUF1610 family)
MKHIANCTPRKPMPKEADLEELDVVYYHHGSKAKEGEPPLIKEGDKQVWKCPNCGHEFVITRTGKISKAASIRKAKEMREKGFRHA